MAATVTRCNSVTARTRCVPDSYPRTAGFPVTLGAAVSIRRPVRLSHVVKTPWHRCSATGAEGSGSFA